MRRGVTAAAVATALCLAVVPGARASSIGELSPAGQSLAQCVQTNHRLSVLMLIDESGSLQTTDPSNMRVDGIRAALTGLAGLADTPVGGERPEVSVLMAGFYARVRPNPRNGPVGPGAWRPVTGATIDSLNRAAGAYARMNTGRATDYGTALLAARQLLRERLVEQSRGGVAPPCEALIWFTDGRYALPLRVGKSGIGLPKTVPYAAGIRLDRPGAEQRAIAAGKAMMCRPNGLMDSLAESGVIRFTVALSTQLLPEDAAFLDAATTGSGGEQHCGSRLSRRTGEYLLASGSDRLFFVFGDLLSGATPVHATDICPRLTCVSGVTTFRAVPGLSGFLIRASSGGEKATLMLTGPDGTSVTLRPGGPEHLSLAGTAVTERWVSPTAVEVQGEFPAATSSWTGRWTYAFVNPSGSSGGSSLQKGFSSVQLLTDLQPAILGRPALIRGVPTNLSFALERSGGAGGPLAAGPLLRGAALEASVTNPVTGTVASLPVSGPNGAGSFSSTVMVPRHSAEGFVYLGVTAHLVAPGGTPIMPQYRTFSVPVRFPPGEGFPMVTPLALHLASVQGVSQTAGTLTVTGSQVAGGCVWVGAPALRAPAPAGRFSIATSPAAQSSAGCLRVRAGESRVLRISLRPTAAAIGDVSGSIPVHLHSDIIANGRVVAVPVTFALVPVPNAARRDVLFVLLIAFGALLPLAVLHGLNYANARFTAPQRLLVLSQGATASAAGVQVDTAPEYTVFKPLSMEGESRKVRTLQIDDIHLRTVASGGLAGLFRGPYGVAEVDGEGRIVAGSPGARLRSWLGGARHEVPLSLVGTWVFVVEREPAVGAGVVEAPDDWGGGGNLPDGGDGASEVIRGRLSLVIANGGDPDMGQTLLEEAGDVLKDDETRGRLGAEPEGEGKPEDAAEPAQRSAIAGRIRELLRKEREVGTAEDGPVPPSDAPTSEEVDPWA